MISRIIIAAAIALFFTPAARVLSQEHPEHPSKGTAAKKGGAEKRVSTADISTGIKTKAAGSWRWQILCLCGHERNGRKNVRHRLLSNRSPRQNDGY